MVLEPIRRNGVRARKATWYFVLGSAGMRDAAIGSVAFFGIRRISEVLALRREDVRSGEDSVAIWVARQKNDPDGVAQWCWVPRHIGELGPSCGSMGLRLGFPVPNCSHAQPLFAATNSNEPPHVISGDSWRKAVTGHFQDSSVSTHSFRRGGAAWYIHVVGVEEAVVQAQGGWA